MDPFSVVAEEVFPYVGDSGSCPGDEGVKQRVNAARRLLYRLGNWKGTTTELAIQSYGGTITLPASFEYIVRAHYPIRPITIRNEWFWVMTDGISDNFSSGCKPTKMNEPVITFRDFGMYYPECEARMEIMFESDREEEGLEVVMHGYSKMGMRVELPRAYGGEGFTGITETPVIDQYVRSLYSISKPATKGRIRIYGYLPDTTKRVLLGFFEGGDVNPSLVRYRVSNRRDYTQQFLVKVKRRYRPIVNDSEPVDISTDALIHALQALAARDSRNDGDYSSKLQLATGFLQRELGEGEEAEQGRIRLSQSFSSESGLTDGDYR